MAFEDDFTEFFAHVVNIAPYASQDGYGAAAYGTGIDYPARIVNTVKMIRAADGQERVSNTSIWIGTDAAISPKDKLTLPSAFSPQTPPILRVDRVTDDEGIHHTKLYA
jgi:hypothetical protein